MEIRWHARGGQGAVVASELLAEAAMNEGLYFQAFPDYGAERAGAPVRVYTRISEQCILEHSPILDTGKCSSCLRCWVFCPEGAIQVKEGKVTGIDLKYCKGCGICFTECPQHAIEMIEETVAKKGV